MNDVPSETLCHEWRSNKGIEKTPLMRSFRICTPHHVFFGMRWSVHVARMTEKRSAYRFLVQKHEGGNLEELGVDGRMKLRLRNKMEGHELNLYDSG